MHRLFAWFHLPGALVLSVLMSLLAVTLFCVHPCLPRFLALVGMLLWSLGDIVLMDYTPITRHLPFHGLTEGGICFMFGHAFFFAAFAIEIARANMPFINAGVWFAIALWAICSAVLVFIKRPGADRSMLLLFVIYLFAMTVVGFGACSCAFSMGGRFTLAAIGFVLFLLSDEAIGLDTVCGIRYANWNDIIWTLYPLGVILIVLGV